MTKSCGACKKFLSLTDGVKCSKCSTHYHRACLGLGPSNKASVSSSWECDACKRLVPRGNRTETPVKSLLSGDDSEATAKGSLITSGDSSSSPAAQSMTLELTLEIRQLREDLQAARGEIQQFRAEMFDLKSSLTDTNDRLASVVSRVDRLEKKVEDTPETSQLESTVAELKLELQERDQRELSNDLDISNLPEELGENPIHLVTLVAAKLGVILEERDIVSAERVGSRHGRGTEGAGAGGADRPRPLAVRVTRRALKDELTKSARVRRGATTADLGLSAAPRPFYINERLTKHNRFLFNKAREAQRRLSWRFVWTKQGRVYARQAQDKAAHWIRTEADLTRVFGSAIEPPINK
ncbi:unnamed protein product [Plutella xylostella]|uniref:(diamondback moth) hypothetical protein n=1 Tax=Plutella xylostella TaxID=51655 RepID=A0A8S4FVC1_PLUXY|nr:unnamed protein product [Plutella xylostella]CAG9137663.1 unnamed protein product [Plutella xylostella]